MSLIIVVCTWYVSQLQGRRRLQRDSATAALQKLGQKQKIPDKAVIVDANVDVDIAVAALAG